MVPPRIAIGGHALAAFGAERRGRRVRITAMFHTKSCQTKNP